MTKNQIIRTVAFLLVVSVLLLALCDLFEYENSHISERIETYQQLPRNTVDAVMVGTSGIDRYWITPKAYEEHGITAYPMSTDGMPSWMIKVMLKEAEKNQNFKLAIIDMRPFLNTYKEGSAKFDAAARRVIDGLDFFSFTRYEAISTTLKLRMKTGDPEAKRNDPSFFLSFIKYHSKWENEDFSFDEIKDPESLSLGFLMHSTASIKRQGQDIRTVKSNKRMALDPICEEVLYDLMKYLKKQDYQVLFFDTPHCHSEIEAKRINTMCDILKEEGFSYLVCDVNDGIYDLKNDFYNDGHVNYYGAEKFTEWFGEYLSNSYDFPDRRLDKKCDKDWIGVYDYIKEGIQVFEDAAAKNQAE
jgi:hypothetical protein